MLARNLRLAALVLLLCVSSFSQERPHVKVENLPPRPEDVATIDGIMQAFYGVISGPAGEPRQWSRDRSLYIPDVRFVSVERSRDGKIQAEPITHQQFVDSSDAALVRRGFYEKEIHRVTQQFGSIAHVFSTYETRIKPDGPVLKRGINSLQLFNDGRRWWVLAAEWEDESPAHPIPAQYLPAK